MDDSFGQRIRAARLERGWSQERLAGQVGTTQSTIERIENGGSLRSRFRHEAAAALGLTVPTAEPVAPPQPLASGYRPPPEFLGDRDFKVFASAECGPGELQVFSTEPYDFYPRPWNVARDPTAFGVLLTGDSMEPLYEAGQFVIVSPKAPLVKGKQALFMAEPMGGDFRASVKRYRGQTADRWLVKQLNPEKEFDFSRKEWGTAYRVLGALDG